MSLDTSTRRRAQTLRWPSPDQGEREGPEGLDADAFADTQREDGVLSNPARRSSPARPDVPVLPVACSSILAERIEAGRQITASRFREPA